MNIFILDKGYNQLGMLSNEGANPQAPYFDDLYVQELETGADTFEFTTLSTSASESMLEIGNHIVFNFNNRQRLFAISTLELEHANGMNVIRVYAEGVGFQLLETYMGEFGEDEDGDGEVDSGEYLTYGQFLERVLADTDWSYQIVSGDLNNINMGREVTFPKGKNIYALLQDSMQVFSGVELEFRGGYSGGGLSKTIYAYANGGRGSFVGKRFEYGINVKGIKKTQEIVDEMDENVILYEGLINVDGLNVQLGYDVDFALRSHEVEELEIGDTHYIIDNDFNPPLQITARIGKIEVSFSDPTKNKCYLANFKKITGSKPDDPDGEDVEDIIDDKMDEIEDLIDEKIEEAIGDLTADHTHDRLVSNDEPLIYEYGKYTIEGTEIDNIPVVSLSTKDFSINFGVHKTNDIKWSYCSIGEGDRIAKIFTSDCNLIPEMNSELNIGSPASVWKLAFIHDIYSNSMLTNIINTDRFNTTEAISSVHSIVCDRSNVSNVSEITDSSSVSKQDLLDFILNDVNLYQYIHEGMITKEISSENYLGLLNEDFEGSEVGSLIKISDDRGSYNLPSLVTALIGAFQQHIENTNGGGGEGGNIDLSAYATIAWVKDEIKAIEMEVGKTIIGIKIDNNNHLIFTFSDSSTIDAGELPSGEQGVGIRKIEVTDNNHLIFTFSDGSTIDAGAINVTSSGGGGSLDGHVDFIPKEAISDQPSDIRDVMSDHYDFVKHSNKSLFMDNMILLGDINQYSNLGSTPSAMLGVVSCASFSCNGSVHADYLHVGGTIGNNVANRLMLDFNTDLVLVRKENENGESEYFRYTTEDLIRIFSSSTAATVNEDLLDEQQNTIQQQQEKIADLEARLAKIEEMLNIDNN